MDIKAFIEKYGYATLGLLVAKFIQLAPPFNGDQAIATEIGTVMGDLEIALKTEVERNRKVDLMDR